MSHQKKFAKIIGKPRIRVYSKLDVIKIAGASGYGLRDARAPIEVPVIRNLDAKILRCVEGEKAIGELYMGSWHAHGTCGTVHCRAGWAIFLGGEAGRKLEKRFGPAVAGTLIYGASTGHVPDFDGYLDERKVLADLRRKAKAGSVSQRRGNR